MAGIALGDRPLHLIVNDYVEHYYHERNQLLAGEVPPASADVRVRRCQRIGGLLNYYHREAARAPGRFIAPYGVQAAVRVSLAAMRLKKTSAASCPARIEGEAEINLTSSVAY